MKKTAFFDMDGTLVAPVFKCDGRLVTGLSPEKWKDLCNKRQEKTYDHCPTVYAVLSYAHKLKQKGWDIKILTLALSEGEKVAKNKWRADASRSEIFSEIIYVDKIPDKIAYILNYAKHNGMSPDDCLLVEDDLNTIFSANETGIRTMHVSHIFTSAYDAAES